MFAVLKPIISMLPEVRRPERIPALNEKLMWTAGVLLVFFILGQIYPIGVDPAGIVRFERLEILLGSRTGTLITAGIGPIVLASIFLQLAFGARLIKLDLQSPEGKKTFQGLQKILAIALSFLEAGIYVFSNYIPAAGALNGSSIAPLIGSVLFTQGFLVLQLALGSIILLYMDEVVQKYGIGSGISLFIAAGVTQAIFVGSLSIAMIGEVPAGLIPQAFYYLLGGDIPTAVWTIVPILFTILVFLVVVYVEGMKIELPLAYGQARGLGARYPIKFLYVSNIPVILAAAVLLNVQLFGLFMSQAGFPLLGTYQNNQPMDGIAYYTTALPSPLFTPGGYPAYIQLYFTQPRELLHIFSYGIALVILCVIFGWFWIESTGMGAKDVAVQLNRTGLQIPGFRQDPRVMEKILERYIPVITVLGSIFVGVLAWFADITGALGTGTGILLTVGILYKFYEDLAQQQIFDMYPVLRKIVK
ncbi:preprotein translocase subunit SecY [Candidatus Micrarchaeota archaeon CG1_02_51_15]|nr:MAG: preprotein translocase subunit SecY [Candidatus Micrarchaeota archaeon CG1_02_51_15]